MERENNNNERGNNVLWNIAMCATLPTAMGLGMVPEIIYGINNLETDQFLLTVGIIYAIQVVLGGVYGFAAEKTDKPEIFTYLPLGWQIGSAVLGLSGREQVFPTITTGVTFTIGVLLGRIWGEN